MGVYQDPDSTYPVDAPYSPAEKYPEYVLDSLSTGENRAYRSVRNALAELGLDHENFGNPQWNPFGEIVRAGDTVVIKPNFVLSDHYEGGDLFSIITHPSVIRAVVDYVYLALDGKGRIIVADTPQMDCNFNELLERTKLESIRDLYKRERGFNLEIYDLRYFWLDAKKGWDSRNRHKLPGDPQGGIVIDLGRKSLFYGVDNSEKFYGADFNRDETIRLHHGEVQKYVMSETILSADVVISVPKLKTHKKVGVTLNIKGLVGTVVNKNSLVHYTLGLPSEGGDQFPDDLLSSKEKSIVGLQRWAYDKLLSKKNIVFDALYRVGAAVAKGFLRPMGFSVDRNKQILDAGNWYGNDSAWRMAVDLYRILLYVDTEGQMHDKPVRRAFSIVDGIVGGECNGPLTPRAKHCGTIIVGGNMGAVDVTCARLMGFDLGKIKMLKYVVDNRDVFGLDLREIKVLGNIGCADMFSLSNRKRYLEFEPHLGWKGQVEVL